MAKVTITFEDKDEDTASISIEFDPPLDNPDDEATVAQLWAMTCVRAVKDLE